MTILIIYKEDFSSIHDWNDICSQLNVPKEATRIEAKISGVHYENPTEEDNYNEFQND